MHEHIDDAYNLVLRYMSLECQIYRYVSQSESLIALRKEENCIVRA